MNEIQGIKGSKTGDGDELATATVLHAKDIGDEKDRAIAKAALTISELGVQSLCSLFPLFMCFQQEAFSLFPKRRKTARNHSRTIKKPLH